MLWQPQKQHQVMGFLAGGGVALVKMIKPLAEMLATLKEDEQTGAQVVLKALSSPLKQIAINAGQDGGVVFEKSCGK